ncbi:hypothetical protein [Spirillospora albida]|uniref:hypothetical protein n=1 Tax=Spirillospora albida TaxID=58123 RepID=UPI000AC8F790|nr:hypothetical protein [Spirillospora albida]
MTTTTRRPPPAARPKKRRAPAPEPARGTADPAPAAEPDERGRRAPRKTRAPKTIAPASETGAPKGAASKGAATKSAASKGTATKDTGSQGAASRKAASKGTAATSAATRSATSKGVARAGQQAPPRTPFVLLIVALLGGALVSLLLLNTVLAEDAFTLTRLQESNKRLEQQRQAYQEEIAREESPAQLAAKARALGMREAERPAFIDGTTGRTTGGDLRPVPAPAAAAAGAAAVVGVPGTVVPGDGVPPAGTGRAR